MPGERTAYAEAVTSARTWDELLTAWEDELNAHEESVRLGELRLVPEFLAPDDLGPLPPASAQRAHDLLGRIRLLCTMVEYQMTATSSDLKYVEQRRSGSLSPHGVFALYVDASA